MLKDKANPNIKVVIVTVHGIESKNENLEDLNNYLKGQGFDPETTHFTKIVYGKVHTWIGRAPILRYITAELVSSRLSTLSYKYPNAKIILIAHSFGTWSTARAIERHYTKFNLDFLILLGCVIKRKFDWSKYSAIEVLNFVGKKDYVVFFARLYSVGRAGKYRFTKECDNLRQIETNWGHTDFIKHFSVIKGEINVFLSDKGIVK